MRNGGEKRGNSRDRLHRKQKMLKVYGNGLTCPCTHCRTPLTIAQLHADRIIPGGSYRWENIQPSCALCNIRRGNNTDWVAATAAA